MCLQPGIVQNADLNSPIINIMLALAATSAGIIFLIILLVMVFFQVIIHNSQQKKRHKETQDRLKAIEDKLNRTEEK
jgi:CHASE3 domain sensor protein